MDATLVGVLAGVLGTVATIASVVVAWHLGRKSERITASQQRIAAHAAAAEWLRDVREWAGEAIEVLSEASYTCAAADTAGEDCGASLRQCQHRLSALIDRGRFFLPNQYVDRVGKHKPTAYRGWRHSALDPLVAAERVTSGAVGSGSFSTREAALIAMRREFVSAIQRILAPDLHNQEIARMIREANEARADDPTLGGLLPDAKETPTGAERLIWQAGAAPRLRPETPRSKKPLN
jgi:hypothetical protein